MGLLSFCLLSLLAIAGVDAAQLSLQSPRFTISSGDASQLRSEPISLKQRPEPLKLAPTDVLKLSFQVVEKDGEKGVQPHQTFLRFFDAVSGEEGIQPVRVSSSGKAKFELNMAKPPGSIPPTTAENPLNVSLLLGSFEHSPARYELFDLFLPASQSAPPHELEHTFHPQPLIHHTFRPEQKVPPRIISAAGAILVLAPWVVLVGFLAHIKPSVPQLLSINIFPFIATLGASEALLFWYWVDLKLGDVLLYGGVLALFTAAAGKKALATKGDLRVGRK
ncbi:Oligosaccharyltransferase subunit Ribophorin II-domain-containing protein [Irpex rosettiformis]|uniref:Oligosaccharyltransferase subunit Ribophorin II-domain-containing protein n=1 Tax=Irpex rosettiformis TaxID=378272 RepID=A0ACB8U7Y4_9APHY|nr:Oligosaccharyltransferase subunit Ribophorin II-domain-containing protein [Irpex rosettiformis]